MKLSEVAERLGAELRDGDGDISVTGVAGIEEAGADQVTFVANPKYAAAAKTTQAAAVIVEPEFADLPVATLRVKTRIWPLRRRSSFFTGRRCMRRASIPRRWWRGSAVIGPRSHVAAYVVIGEGVTVGAMLCCCRTWCCTRGVTVGDRFLAHAHAVVREYCTLGDDVTLQNGVIIGADGFGFAKDGDGRWVKIVQAGPAVLEDSVEVQANACIDRASVGETRIGRGAKVDNLVQVGHGSAVGENTLLCSQVGLAGSTVVGRNAILTGQVGVSGHLTIGDGAIITAQSGVGHDVAPGAVMSGSPEMDNATWRRMVVSLPRLPEMLRRLKALSGDMNKTTSVRSFGFGLVLLAAACGCHSRYVEATVVNTTGTAVSLVEVDYPSASFGRETLAAGAEYHYRFKVLGSGGTKVLWTDGTHGEHSVAGAGAA